MSSSILISSCKINSVVKPQDISSISEVIEAGNEIPQQQIFEVSDHHKHRFLSDVGKRTINEPTGNERLNFVRLPGRNSVKKDERTPTSKSNSRVLPSRLRGNFDYQNESGKKTTKKKYGKDLNHSMVERMYDPPMIINQMKDATNFGRLTELKNDEVMTPKSVVRRTKPLKTDSSYKSQAT